VTNPSGALDPPVRSRSGGGSDRHLPPTADILLAVLYVAVFLGATFVISPSFPRDLPWTTGLGPGSIQIDLRVELGSRASVALMLACGVALAFRRSSPVGSFLAIVAVAAVQALLGEPIAVWNVAMAVSLFSVAAYGSRRFSRVALGLAIAGYVGIWVMQTGALGRLDGLADPLAVLATQRGAAFVAMFAVLVVIWALGDQVRSANERLAFQRERIEQRERQQEATARLETLAERQRIARELHDVVAHGLSVIIVQADGARYAEATHPEAPRQALATIAATGRESLTEMRRLLGILRDDPDAPRLAPQPDLAAVPALVDGFREAGLAVEMRIDGTPRPLPPAVGLTAYRVVQESLTNVLHHVGPTHVRVGIRLGDDALAILVENTPGASRPAASPGDRQGLGLLGMRERVGLLGGRMVAGPMPDGGFRVRVELPIRAPLAQDAPAWDSSTAGSLELPDRAGGRP
jgi:signal transduction histidine kinase